MPPLMTTFLPATSYVDAVSKVADEGMVVELIVPAVVFPDSVGVVKVGDVERTLLPLPVEEVTPVPPLATAKVPARLIAPEVAEAGVSPVVPPAKVVTPVVEVSRVADDGIVVELIVPAVVLPDSVGVVRVGEVERTLLPLPVEVVTPVPPASTGSVPAASAVAEVE